MLKRYSPHLLAAASACFLATGALAQTQIQGVDAFVTGDFFDGADDFGPGSAEGPGATVAETQVVDDGSGNDAVAGDDIFTATMAVEDFTEANVDDVFSWKIASNGFSPVNTPDAGFDNLAFIVVPGAIDFFVRISPFNDGFSPDVEGNFSDGYPWTSAYATMFTSGSLQFTGDFQSEAGFGADFDATAAPTLTDSGDGIIYTTELTGLPNGTYNGLFVTDNSFGPVDVKALGPVTGGSGDISFSSGGTSDTITVEFNVETARFRFTSTSPALPGPPFWVVIDDNVTTDTAPFELADGNGDGIYQGTFTIDTAGTHTVSVRQATGVKYPGGNGTAAYPFETTAASQEVTVFFDTNTYSDGANPDGAPPSGLVEADGFVVVLVGASGAAPQTWDRIQIVGNGMGTVFGSSGGDFDTDIAALELVDDGTNGDLVSGDGVFTAVFTAFSGGTFDQVKAVGTPSHRTNPANPGFKYQLGGISPDGGLSVDGNNNGFTSPVYVTGPNWFQVDTLTGRLSHGSGSAPSAVPSRGDYQLTEPASATNFELYQ
ncbi:MAG: choice-of-anchor X domain-containing protein [Sumerlaeia bacterium]